MDKNVQFIRKDYKVFPVQRPEEGTPWVDKHLCNEFDSISAAKRWSRQQPAGTVRRYQSLEREHGKAFMKELFK